MIKDFVNWTQWFKKDSQISKDTFENKIEKKEKNWRIRKKGLKKNLHYNDAFKSKTKKQKINSFNDAFKDKIKAEKINTK